MLLLWHIRDALLHTHIPLPQVTIMFEIRGIPADFGGASLHRRNL